LAPLISSHSAELDPVGDATLLETIKKFKGEALALRLSLKSKTERISRLELQERKWNAMVPLSFFKKL
ncbi:hypothetical protein HDU98_005359, partial [Podochytrium sp. JEL0797]